VLHLLQRLCIGIITAYGGSSSSAVVTVADEDGSKQHGVIILIDLCLAPHPAQ